MDAITELAGAAMGGVQLPQIDLSKYDICEECEGSGEYPVEDDRDVERYINCSRCDGYGVTQKPSPLAILGPGGDYTTTIEE